MSAANRKARRVFASAEKARRAGVEILHASPGVWASAWTGARKCGIEALRGVCSALAVVSRFAFGRIWAGVGCLALAAAVVLAISAATVAVPVVLVFVVLLAIWWRFKR